MPVPENIHLFRMIHWQNVEHVLQNGLCCREHESADPDYINIGHRGLISDRHEYEVGLPDAGNLGDYIPFYFGGHSPMLFLILRGYQGVEKRAQEDIVYIICSFQKIKEAGLEFVFTDMNAKRTLANFYNQEEDFEKVHWDIVKSKEWKNDENNIGRKDFKQAEFLVRNYIPVECISAIVVKTEERKLYFEEIMNNLALQINVHVDTNSQYYY